MKRLFHFSLLFLGSLLMLNGYTIQAQDNKPEKPRKWPNAWAPEGKPLRGILHFDGRQAGNSKPWQPFCERHGLVWFPHEGDDILQEKRLAEIAAELKHPELINAPVIRVGLSSNGGSTILLAHQHPDRMLAGVAHQPLPPFAKGNEGFNFNRINEKGILEGKVHDISQSFRVPCILQAGENDPVCGTIMAYGLADYARSQKAPWTYFCLPRGGHGNVVPSELLMAWLDGVIAQRLPAAVDLSKGLPKLNDIRIEAGWLTNPHTLEIAEFAKYAGDKSKATWLPNEASALAWKKLGKAMPYELPKQSVGKPSGLIDKLVIHDPKSNRVVPSDAVHAEPWKIIANLKPGDTGWKVQPNCSVTVIGKVPELVRGCDWIKPDNASLAFTGEVLMEFTVNDKATVYVAHDEKLAKKPDWLADWKDTGESLQGGYLGNERSFRLFEKEYPKGATVKLGPNGAKLEPQEKSKLEPWIYLTIVKRQKDLRAADPPQWETAATLQIDGLDISLSKPRLVTRGSGHLWFPTMTRLSGGELFANFSTNVDAIVAARTSSVSWSDDNGLTWSTPRTIDPKADSYAETMLRLKNGDQLLLPFNLYPDRGEMRGWYQVVSGKRGVRKVEFFDKALTVSGWPRPDRSFNEKLGLSGFGFNGQCVPGKTGEYLATMYGYFKDERRYSLVLVESKDGINWRFRSLIAGADCKLKGGEGPCESVTVRLKDGRLMNIFRLASNVTYGQTFSEDDGRTWSAPVAMKEAHSVQPSLAVMKDGGLVLTGGRPGIFAWLNRDGTGKDWLRVDLQSHHNQQQPGDAITDGKTTSYTEVEPLDDRSVIVMYDRIANGWSAIPKGSNDTNSIWVVKVSWKQRAADEKPAPLHKVISRGEAAGPYQAFPDACRLKNGDILAVFYAGYGHVSTPNAQWPKGGRICMVRSSDEGRTWSKPDILFDDELDNRDPHIAQMSDGALICSFFNAPGKSGVQIVRSLDGGKTWDQKSQSVVPEWYCSAPVREMPDGTYILGVYYENGGKAWGGVTRSTDRGKTWSDPIPIDKDSGVRLDAETDVVLLKDGSLYAALRGDAVPMHFASSRDLGRTWSPVKNIGFRAHCPHFTRLSSGEILLTHRIPNTSLHVSRDEGRSWQGPYSIDTVGGAYPSTVELKDKSVLAIYYEEGANSAIRAARFRLNPQGIEKLPLNAE